MQMRFLGFLFVCLLGSIATAISTTTNAVIERTEASSSKSSPNPIASLYPYNVTGTINSTISVVPIPYKLARSIIPSQHGILTKAYDELLPGFPPDSYPVRSLHRPENLDKY
jgi:cellobiose-specific phosphotransferase system component IIC